MPPLAVESLCQLDAGASIDDADDRNGAIGNSLTDRHRGCLSLRYEAILLGRTAMQVVVKGKNIEVSEKLRQFMEGKLSKLERVLPGIAEAEVELSSFKTKSAGSRYVVEVTLKANGTLIRGEQASDDAYSAMDAVLGKIDRQVARFKTKRQASKDKGAATTRLVEPAEEFVPAEEEEEEEHEGRLVRVKRFAMKPMDVQEALTQMEMLGHDFYVFFNSESDRVGVVYRRRDGDFGLIEPE